MAETTSDRVLNVLTLFAADQPAWSVEEAADALIYLAIRNFQKGERNVREWFAARNQFAIMFDERFKA